MNEIVNQHLGVIEQERHCRVLFAMESGSRAWGFSSPDSDYDVRFVYVHDVNWYLSLLDHKDVVERMLPGELDLAGWDLRKALKIFAECNLAFNEWLESPVIYWDHALRQQLRELVGTYFNPKKALYHYLSLGAKTMKAELQDEKIKIKRLFYVLRSFLACYWILQKGAMPPTLFHTMLEADLLPVEVVACVQDLLARKAVATEGELIDVPRPLLEWLTDADIELKERAAHHPPPAERPDIAPLDKYFRDLVLPERVGA